MLICGTDSSCEGCPINSNIVEEAVGTFNYRYEEAERLGEAAEKLQAAGYRDLSICTTEVVATVLDISYLEDAPTRLRLAIQRLGSPACRSYKPQGEE